MCVVLESVMTQNEGESRVKGWGLQGRGERRLRMMRGQDTVYTAVEDTRIGTADVLEKPIMLQTRLQTIAGGLARPVLTPALEGAARLPERRADELPPL